MEKRRHGKTTSSKRATRAPKKPAVVEARKGRPRLPAETEFAAWLDGLKGVPVEDVAAAAGIAVSSLYHIRRGAQGVSMEVARRLIAYSGGVLSIDSFTATKQKDSEKKHRR